jgi:hypothetical protein
MSSRLRALAGLRKLRRNSIPFSDPVFTMQRLPYLSKMARALPLLALVPWMATANDAALQKCRAMEDPFARLKCYDAIPLAGNAQAAAPSSSITPAVATAAAPVAAPSTPPASPPVSQFGLPAKAPDADVNRIESSIVGKFEGWRANSNIRLANGQVWQIADDSSRFLDLDNPKVAVRRGALTSFYMEIDGTNYSPRVRRVK